MRATILGCCSLHRGGGLLNETPRNDKVFYLFGLRPWLKLSAALLLYIHGSVRAIGGDAREAGRERLVEKDLTGATFAEAWDLCQSKLL